MGSLSEMGILWGPIPVIDTIVTTTLCPGFPAQILSRNFGENSENLACKMMPLDLCGDADHTVLAHRVLLTSSNMVTAHAHWSASGVSFIYCV